MNPRGNPNPNIKDYASNRKGKLAPSTLIAIEIRKTLVQRVKENLEPLLQALLNTAKGFQVVDEKDINKVLYTRVPDLSAVYYLLNQVIGKAAETIKFNDESERPYANLPTGELIREVGVVIARIRETNGINGFDIPDGESIRLPTNGGAS